MELFKYFYKMNLAWSVFMVLLALMTLLNTTYDLFGLHGHLIKNDDTNFLEQDYIFVVRGIKDLLKRLNKGPGTPLPPPANPQNPLTPPLMPPETKQTRDMATWHTIKRYEPPKKAPYPPMKRDPETNLEIMHEVDYSGKNHFLLKDDDYKSEVYYKVYGSFTKSPSPLKGVPPVFFSEFTLEGQSKTQFIHIYAEPKLFPKIAAESHMHYTSMFLLPRDKMNDLISDFYKKKKQNDDDKFQ